MLKYAPYSFSKISSFILCPKKFKYKYIDKIPQEPRDMTALLKGSCVHSMLEKYPSSSTNKLVPRYQYILDKFLKSKYKEYLQIPSRREESFGLTSNLECTNYKDKNALFRGFIDYYTVKDDKMIIIDYKTGKYKDEKFQDFTQLMYYAIYMFKKYSKIDKIEIMYLYVEHELDNSLLLERKYLNNYCTDLLTNIRNIETSEYPKKVQVLCDYCEYQNSCNEDIV